MQNVELKVVDTKLVIEIHLNKNFGLSKSGKTVMVASTQGNAQIPGRAGHFVGLNVFAYPDKRRSDYRQRQRRRRSSRESRSENDRNRAQARVETS